MRTEPPVSLPRPPADIRAAAATPVPLLEPPGLCRSFQGLRKAPYGGSMVTPMANSYMLSLPRMTAPASINRDATVASRSAIEFS